MRKLRFVSGWIFVLCLAMPGLLGAASPGGPAGSPETLKQRLEALDSKIQAHLRRVADQAAAGEATDADLLDDAQGLRRQLEALERAAREEQAPPAYEAKLRQLGLLVGNLEKSGREGASVGVLPSHGLRPVASISPFTALTVPANDDCMNAVAVGFGSYSGTTSGATNDAPASCGASLYSPDVWFKYTAPGYGYISADTFGSGYDTVLSAYSACPATVSGERACNDDAFGLHSAVSFYTYGGEEYWIRVSGFDGATGAFQLHLGEGGTISGTVTDEGTGDPLVDGWVTAYGSDGYYAASAPTGVTGAYTLGSLEADGYLVGADDFAGYLGELYDDVPCPGGPPYGCAVGSGTAVPVSSSGNTGGVDFALGHGGSIGGTVTRFVGGTPIADLRVEVYNANGNYVADDYTAADGTYLVRGLAGGDHFVLATSSLFQDEMFDDMPCSSGCYPTTATPVHVQLGVTSGGIDFALDELGSISGVITSGGAPVSSLYLEVYRAETAGFYYAGEAFTDSVGAYLVAGLSPGTYAVRTYAFDTYVNEVYDNVACCNLSAGMPIPVALNAAVTGIDFDLDRLGKISGTVTDAATGDPISGVTVEIRTPSGDWVGWAGTNSSGQYTSYGIGAGTYAVRTHLFSPGYLNELYQELPCPGGTCDPASGTPVAVTVNTTTAGIDFTLDWGGSISGTLTDSAGNPIPYYPVAVYGGTGSWVANKYTNSTGAYQVLGLEPGTYHVLTSEYYYEEFFDELYDGLPCEPDCDPTTGTPVTVVLGEETGGVNFVLDRLGSVTGSVFDEDTGEPLVGIEVRAWDADGSLLTYGYTNSTGTYALQGLPVGTCYVSTAHAYYDGYLDELFSDIPCYQEYGCNPTKGSPVPTFLDTTTENVSFALRASGSTPRGTGGLQGTVEDAVLGLPLLGVLVDVWDGGGSHVATVVSDAAGRYDVSLAPGSYFVSTDNRRGFVDEVYNGVLCPGGGCDPTLGTAVPVGGGMATGIDFALAGKWEIFADGFESGDVSRWSSAVGNVP